MNATIYTHANVITLDATQPRAQGIRVEDGYITHIFEGEIPQELEGKRVDLMRATVLPGFHDAHFHLEWLGKSLLQLDLKGTLSQNDLTSRLQEAVQKTPQGQWIIGNGWDENLWPVKALPSRDALDLVSPDHPVLLHRVDGHMALANSKALALAKIDEKTPDPEGGRILRDLSNRPTGILIDNAIHLMNSAQDGVSEASMQKTLLKALDACKQAGLSAVHDMGATPLSVHVLRRLEADGLLTLRVYAYVRGTYEDMVKFFEREKSPLVRNEEERKSLVQIMGMKLFVDGSLGSRAALLKAPYSDDFLNSGLQLSSREELTRLVKLVHESGFQAAIHAIGDKANALALDIIRDVQGTDTSRRHRIEHAQIIDPIDIPRFAPLGVIASMQPTHCTSDMPWVENRLGNNRLIGAYAWQSLLQNGAKLALGSDAPVETFFVWPGIYAAISRQDSTGKPDGGFMPKERLELMQALSGFTTDASYAVHDEDLLGSISVGKKADLSVVSADPFQIEATRLPQIYTMRTIVEGKEVFVSED